MFSIEYPQLTVQVLFFTLFPAIAFSVYMFEAWRLKEWDSLNKNAMLIFVDWIFVPFNFIVISHLFITDIRLVLFGAFSIFTNIIIHYFWSLSKNSTLLFGKKTVRPAGVMHMAFSISQMTIMLLYYFSSVQIIIADLLMMCYFLPFFWSSKRNHGRVKLSDALIAFAGMGLVAIRWLF